MKVGLIGLGPHGPGHGSCSAPGRRSRPARFQSDGGKSGGPREGGREDRVHGRRTPAGIATSSSAMVSDDAALNEVSAGRRTASGSAARETAFTWRWAPTAPRAIQTLDAAHAESGQTLVAAPVLGRPDAAAAGQLVIVAAGPPDAIEALRARVPGDGPQDRRGRRAAPEAAIAIKLANNFVLACAIEAMAEAFALVRKCGVQPQVFYEVITEGLFAAPAYKVVRQAHGRSGLRQARLHGRRSA